MIASQIRIACVLNLKAAVKIFYKVGAAEVYKNLNDIDNAYPSFDHNEIYNIHKTVQLDIKI